MARSKQERQEKVTVYFDKRAEEQKAEEAEQEEAQQKVAEMVGELLGAFIKPAILMLLWNWLMPGLFGLVTIGYLKAFAIYLLCRIMFK